MNATALMWFLAGAGTVLMVQALLRLLRSAAGDGDQYQPEHRRTPPLLSGEIPYRIDRRPTPMSEDLEVLLPRRVGPYERRNLRVPKDIHRSPIYAAYYSGTAMVFVELGICGDPDGAQGALSRAKRETDAEFPDDPQLFVCGPDPSFRKLTLGHTQVRCGRRGIV